MFVFVIVNFDTKIELFYYKYKFQLKSLMLNSETDEMKSNSKYHTIQKYSQA